jgi:hypothetical protein
MWCFFNCPLNLPTQQAVVCLSFTAGDVATWSGVVTGGLMLLSPLLFERWGWRGVANTTPNMLLWGGSAFFAACIAYQHLFGATVAAGGAAAAGPVSLMLLQVGFGVYSLMVVGQFRCSISRLCLLWLRSGRLTCCCGQAVRRVAACIAYQHLFGAAVAADGAAAAGPVSLMLLQVSCDFVSLLMVVGKFRCSSRTTSLLYSGSGRPTCCCGEAALSSLPALPTSTCLALLWQQAVLLLLVQSA